MDEGGTKRQRKKPLNLDGQQWEQVRVFVEEFFEQQPQKASKATYRSLFQEIQARYPCIILSESSFKKYVAPIQTLRERAGIQGEVEISRNYFQRVSEIFHEILIGLPLDEFKSIKLEGLIQHADEGHPELHIIDKNRKTLADRFSIKQLKACARAQRPPDEATAPVGRHGTVQAQKPPDPPAPGAAAAIVGERRAERQGQLSPGVKRRPADEFDYPPESPDGQDDSELIFDRPQRSAESAVQGTCVMFAQPANSTMESKDAPASDCDAHQVVAAEETLLHALLQGMRVGGNSKVVQDAAYSSGFAGERPEGEGGGGDDIGDGGRGHGGGGGGVSGAGVSDALMDADDSIKDGED